MLKVKYKENVKMLKMKNQQIDFKGATIRLTYKLLTEITRQESYRLFSLIGISCKNTK